MSEGLQVIGVGMHRTGSMSVKAALERLGFGPCYHGLEALRRSTDGEHWLAAYEAGGEFDWPVILEGCRATLDWPTAHFWEQLAAAYPDAKILLTERDPERWWDSHVEMFQRSAELERELTDEQRQWAEGSGFGRMRAALPAGVRTAQRTGTAYRAGRAAAGLSRAGGLGAVPRCRRSGRTVPTC